MTPPAARHSRTGPHSHMTQKQRLEDTSVHDCTTAGHNIMPHLFLRPAQRQRGIPRPIDASKLQIMPDSEGYREKGGGCTCVWEGRGGCGGLVVSGKTRTTEGTLPKISCGACVYFLLDPLQNLKNPVCSTLPSLLDRTVPCVETCTSSPVESIALSHLHCSITEVSLYLHEC